ncbi:MAG: hydroxymethylbilane synthase [Clostridia bacterium]|nr:hydroxymethylbilane synthase [Clostridia bacterium]
MTREIIIGTRDSQLALWQTNWALNKLKELNPEYNFSIRHIKTHGDKITDVALAKIGDKGLFTKELEIAMLEGEIDIAVHSMKDLPTKLPEGLKIGAICEREIAQDVLISPHGYTFDNLPEGAKVGTSSLRRRAQLLSKRPDLNIVDLRGNLNTRLRKMSSQNFDAIILAAAGVIRMGWKDKISQYLPYNVMLPAVGQGSIGIEIREDDPEIERIIDKINDQISANAIKAERAFLARLEGGCQIPIGALGQVEKDSLTLKGLVASLDGRKVLQDEIKGSPHEADELGVELANRLIARGADEILNTVRQETDASEK